MTSPKLAEVAFSRRWIWRIAVTVAPGVALVIALWWAGPVPQARDYMAFADGRALLGVPNGCNVLSNAAFALVGAAGLWLVAGRQAALRDPRERAPWLVFFIGVTMTGLGSAWFHLAPSIDSLVWDRLPMAVAFTALLSALVAERIDPRVGAALLWPIVLVGVASVAAWWVSERAGAGDLRLYLVVQFYPLLAVPLVLVLFPARYSGGLHWVSALCCYAAAKVAEVLDEGIFRLGTILSGHTVKHLLAAAGIAALVWMLASRRIIARRSGPASAAEREPVLPECGDAVR
jgi:hypothetical protein